MSPYKITIKNTTRDKATIGEDLTGKDVIVGKTIGKEAHIGLGMKGNSIAIGKTTRKNAYVGRWMDDNSIAIGKTIGKEAHIGWDMKDNSIVIGKTTGKEADIGLDMCGNSITIGKTTEDWAFIGRNMHDNSIAIGKTTEKNANVGASMRDNSIAIGKTIGKEAGSGVDMNENSIAIGKTTGIVSIVGAYMKNNSVAIGKTTGKYANIGYHMKGSSIAIGKTTGKYANLGYAMEGYDIAIGKIVGEEARGGTVMKDNSLALGFERDEFVIKHVGAELVRQKQADFSKNVKKLNTLLKLDDLLSEELFGTPYTVHKRQKHKLDPEHWSDHIDNKSFQKNTIFPAVNALQASRVLKLGSKQILPIEGESRNLQFLKQIGEYDRICDILTTAEAILIEKGIPEKYWKETMDIQKKRFGLKIKTIFAKIRAKPEKKPKKKIEVSKKERKKPEAELVKKVIVALYDETGKETIKELRPGDGVRFGPGGILFKKSGVELPKGYVIIGKNLDMTIPTSEDQWKTIVKKHKSRITISKKLQKPAFFQITTERILYNSPDFKVHANILNPLTLTIEEKKHLTKAKKPMELIEIKPERFPSELRKKTFTKKEIKQLFKEVSEEIDERIEEKFKHLEKDKSATTKTEFGEIFENKEKGIALSLGIHFTENGKFKGINLQSHAEKPTRDARAYANDFYDFCLNIIRDQIDKTLLEK